MLIKHLSVLLFSSTLAFSQTAFSASADENPFTLVYKGAITENLPDEVNIHPVTYDLHGIKIAANVYTPPGYDVKKRYPTVVVAHPNGGVKEQVAGLYAQRLAKQGFITIAADAAYQGGSGGKPRYVDIPANRISDIHGMADFISTFNGVDAGKIGVLGICGGGGYSLAAAQTDKRFKSVATLSMFNSGRVRRNGYNDSQIDTIQSRLADASEAKKHEVEGGTVEYVGGQSLTREQIAKLPFELYREGLEYYGFTHKPPNSQSKYTKSSLLELMRWDATDHIDLINQPLLMIAGSEADSLYMSENAFNLAVNAKDKDLYLLKGATHIDTYWKTEYVEDAVSKLDAFFIDTL